MSLLGRGCWKQPGFPHQGTRASWPRVPSEAGELAAPSRGAPLGFPVLGLTPPVFHNHVVFCRNRMQSAPPASHASVYFPAGSVCSRLAPTRRGGRQWEGDVRLQCAGRILLRGHRGSGPAGMPHGSAQHPGPSTAPSSQAERQRRMQKAGRAGGTLPSQPQGLRQSPVSPFCKLHSSPSTE